MTVDVGLERWINAHAGTLPPLDAAMVAAASLGAATFAILAAGWLVLALWRRSATELRGVVGALCAVVAALGANAAIGHLFYRARPFVADPMVHLLVPHPADASFPSDHAAAAFAIGVVLASVHRGAGVAALAAAVVLSVARVYVGDHYPLDVLTGAVVGIAAAGAALAVVRLVWRPRSTIRRRSALL